MVWKITYASEVLETLETWQPADSRRVIDFLNMAVAGGDPRAYGISVGASWQYFVDEFGIVCQILEAVETVRVGLLYVIPLNETHAGTEENHIFFSWPRYH
jgi:hypothetical protein